MNDTDRISRLTSTNNYMTNQPLNSPEANKSFRDGFPGTPFNKGISRTNHVTASDTKRNAVDIVQPLQMSPRGFRNETSIDSIKESPRAITQGNVGRTQVSKYKFGSNIAPINPAVAM